MFDLKKVPLPDYSRKEDIANSVSHLLGVPFCIIAIGFILKLQISTKASAVAIFASLLYLISTLIVFAGSAVYHGMKPSDKKQIARVADHSNIYIMIAGTVTAFVLSDYNSLGTTKSKIIVIAIWVVSAVGILLTFMDLKKFNAPQVIMYVVEGWAGIIGMKSIYTTGDMGREFVYMVLAGGASITLGTVLYFIGKKRKYFHAVFHVFVLIGSVFIFIGYYNFHEAMLIL